MTERDLLRILKEEEADSASYYDSEIAAAQADAMDRYHAKAYGDEVEGRSRVVTHDIEDTVNWIMPHLLRTFSASDELITCDDDGLEDGDPALKQAAEYLSHVWFKDNPGDVVTHDFAFDGLVQKFGVLRAYWEDAQPKPVKELEGVPAEMLARYLNDPEYEILEQEAEVKQIEGQPYECFNIRVKHTPKIGRARVEAIPGEEFRVARRSRRVDEDYHGWKRETFLAEILAQFPDRAHELDPTHNYTSKDDSVDIASDARRESRFPDEPTVTAAGDSGDKGHELGRRKVWQMIEYLKCDYDGDGVVELRRINRVGDVILENDAVDESEFTVWSPIRVAHRLIGRSLADTLIDLQKIRTVLTRRALDSLALSTQPRAAVNTLMETDETIEQLLDHTIGGVVRVRGPANEAIQTITMPDTSDRALAMIEYMDRRSEEASGVNRHAMGIQPQAITDTKGGIELLQAAANARIEQVARWLALGLQDCMSKVLRLLIAHQDGPRQVKIAGKRIMMDPRRWSDEMSVSVHVGEAGASRERRLISLNLIAQKQEQIILQGGMANPIAGLKEYRNTLAQMVQTMGFKSAGAFFKEVPDDFQPPPAQPDPKVMEVQQKGQLAQAQLQADQQKSAAEFQHKAQLAAAEHELERQTTAAKAEADRETMILKLQSEREIAMARIESERQLAVARLQSEMELARWKAAEEMKLRAKDIDNKASMGSDRPGGRLDA